MIRRETTTTGWEQTEFAYLRKPSRGDRPLPSHPDDARRSNQDTWDGRRPMRLLHHTTCDSFLLTPRNVRRKVRQSGPAAAEVGMSDDADDTDKGVGPVQRAES